MSLVPALVADQGAWVDGLSGWMVCPDGPHVGRCTHQVSRLRTVPGVVGIETSRVWPKEDRTPAPAHRLVDLNFADYAAVTTAEADELFASTVDLATGGVRIVFAEVEEW